jgi:hypothetical protein
MSGTTHSKIIILILAAFMFIPLGFGQMTSRTENGVSIIKNGKRPLPLPGQAVKVILKPLYTIGGGDSPDQEFSSISSIAVRDDGAIYILDSKECRISAFDAQGRFLFSFGKKGQGPGELAGPISLSLTPSKEILVEDALSRRLAFFAFDGKFLRHQSTAEGMALAGLVMDARGRIVARTMNFADGKIGFDIKTVDRDLKPLKSLARVDLAKMGQGKMDPLSGAPGLLVAPDVRGNIFLGNPRGYAISVFDFEGRLLRTMEREYDPVPVGEEDEEEILKMAGQATATGGFNLKEMILFPDFFPAYRNFIVHPDGTLLVLTFEKSKIKKENFYDIFDPDGRYVFRFSSAVNFYSWQGDRLYGVEENEEGFPVLKCFRVLREK